MIKVKKKITQNRERIKNTKLQHKQQNIQKNKLNASHYFFC